MGVHLLIAAGLALVATDASAAGGVAQPGCPTRAERLDLLDEGEQALVEADFGTAETKLRALEGAFSCGQLVEPELLARMWLLEGAWLTLQGDAEQGATSFQAAARVAPATWVSDFGTALRSKYEAAIDREVTGSTTLSLEPDLFRWIGAIDGKPSKFPTSVSPGLHLVQVGASIEDVRFSRIIIAFSDTPVVVVTGLVEPTSTTLQPVPGSPRVVEREKVESPPLALHVGVGGSASFGADPAGPESGTKLSLPIETGVLWHPVDAAWTRLAFVAGPLLTGTYAWTDGAVPTSSPSQLGVHAAGGFSAGQGDLGLQAGWQWPGRFALRGVIAGHVPNSQFRAEGRIGVNVPTTGAPETALDLVLEFTPRLVRRRADPEQES
jgi:hypothetical protein